jgi:hypothetical protein
MARRNQRRDKQGRFASSASRSTQVKRAVPSRVVKGTRKVRVGRVGPGGAYAGVRLGVELKPRRGRARYYVGASAGRKMAN